MRLSRCFFHPEQVFLTYLLGLPHNGSASGWVRFSIPGDHRHVYLFAKICVPVVDRAGGGGTAAAGRGQQSHHVLEVRKWAERCVLQCGEHRELAWCIACPSHALSQPLAQDLQGGCQCSMGFPRVEWKAGRKMGCPHIPDISKVLFWLQESRLLKGLVSWKEQGDGVHFALGVEYWFCVTSQPWNTI